MKTQGRLRWAIFTSSVLSAIDNPDAHLWRALGTRLSAIGHDAIFFEPRGNEAVRALLRRSGSRPLKEFRAQHPEIEYRTLEPKQGADLVEWMTRTLATADVAVIQASASPDLIAWLGKLTRPHLQTFYLDSGWNQPGRAADQMPDELSEYTAILAGDDQLVRKYAEVAPRVRILPFGPLPDIQPLDDLAAADTSQLSQACQRLIDVVTATRVDTATQRRAPIIPNGHPH